jgi:hypothetical protein
MNTSVKAPFSSQLDQLAVLDSTSAEAIALIWAMLVQHSESLDDLDRQDLQTFVDLIDSVSSKKIKSIYAPIIINCERRQCPRWNLARESTQNFFERSGKSVAQKSFYHLLISFRMA